MTPNSTEYYEMPTNHQFTFLSRKPIFSFSFFFFFCFSSPSATSSSESDSSEDSSSFLPFLDLSFTSESDFLLFSGTEFLILASASTGGKMLFLRFKNL
jgi:hypothetical protein